MFMIVLLITVTIANCLEPAADDKIDDEIKKVITKYLNNIPDVEPQYVINKGLSQVISRYFKGKVSTFPLYKISLKLDRNPVKIPWTLGTPSNESIHFVDSNDSKLLQKGKTYEYVAEPNTNKTV